MPTTDERFEKIEDERVNRQRISDRDEHERDIRSAEERARREAFVDAKLESHEQRLNAINGSINRMTKSVEDLKNEMVNMLGEKKGILSLQNKQIALVGVLATIGYILITFVK